MMNRRTFLGALSGGSALAGLHAQNTQPAAPPKPLAVVTTEWRYRSHAWHMATRFMVGYPLRGRWHRPPFRVVSAYVDQKPEKDLTPALAAEFGFEQHATIAKALRRGGKKLAVEGVLLIGEHGDYPQNEIGQKQYPRYQFFKAITDVFNEDGCGVPVFNDKHLSWKWEWAKEMVATARDMGFPFLAGSSLPVTWRMPAIDLPYDAACEEVVCVAMGSVDVYDFHALETIQCMAERRRGGEVGVRWLEALRGDAVWQAMAQGSFARGGWDPSLFESCLSRSHTLSQPPTFSHRYPTPEQIRAWVKEPVAYRFEYNDGLKATMLLMNGLVDDFTVAWRLRDRKEPLSTLFQLPPNPNVVYSAALMSKAEEMFRTGKAPYPVERTLLTSGLVEAGLKSLAAKRRLETPHLAVRYTAPKESQFWRD